MDPKDLGAITFISSTGPLDVGYYTLFCDDVLRALNLKSFFCHGFPWSLYISILTSCFVTGCCHLGSCAHVNAMKSRKPFMPNPVDVGSCFSINAYD